MSLSLYEALIKQAFDDTKGGTVELESLNGSIQSEGEKGLTEQGEVEIVLVSDCGDTDTLGNLLTSFENKGHTVRLVHTDVYATEAVNSSNGIDTVVRKMSPPSGKGGAVAKMDLMEYRTIRVVRPWDLLDAIEKETELVYTEDPELSSHLKEEGYAVASTTEEAMNWVDKERT